MVVTGGGRSLGVLAALIVERRDNTQMTGWEEVKWLTGGSLVLPSRSSSPDEVLGRRFKSELALEQTECCDRGKQRNTKQEVLFWSEESLQRPGADIVVKSRDGVVIEQYTCKNT